MTTENPFRNQPVGKYFRSIKVIHGALVLGLVLFAMVSVFINSSKEGTFQLDDSSTIFLAVLVPLAAGGVVAGIFLFKQRLKAAQQNPGLPEKLQDYSVALIIKYALLEGPALFALVNYFNTNNYIFLGIATVLILILALDRPTAFKVITDLNLSPAERKIIENPNNILS